MTTPRQLDTLSAIARLTRQWGYPPTYTELRDELGIKGNNRVYQHVKALEAQGLVTRRPGTWRSLRVRAAGRDALLQRQHAQMEATP